MISNISFSPFKNISLYKTIVSLMMGFIGFLGIFVSSSFDFNGFSVNFTWSLILPLLVSLAWGIKYGIISITLGLVIVYPFILGSYNGWASLVPAISLCLWIIIHGYGSENREKSKSIYFNIYFLQFIYIIIRMLIYVFIFPLLIRLNNIQPPFWNADIITSIDSELLLLFAIKGIIVESIFLALCDALLLLPFIRKIFRLKTTNATKHNTKIMITIVFFGLSFALVILTIHNYIIDQHHILYWLLHPNEKTKITFLLTTILFFIMGGITVRYVQRMLEVQDDLKIREKQLENAVEEIESLNESLEQRIAKRTAELENAVCELEGFAYTISHDLKSPLRAIEGYSTIIQEDYADALNNDANEMIGNVKDISNNMIHLIDRLLDYAVTSKAKLKKEPVFVKNVVESVFYEHEIANPTLTMQLAFEGELPTIYVDKVLFKQAISNGISNAIKFSRNKEIIQITAGCKKTCREYIFFIKDNGVGFNMKYADKLFHVFQRLHRTEDFEGTGIGLATIRKVIQKHGGRVWIEGVQDQGAILYFTIPFNKDVHKEGDNNA
ncbi:Phytochrome-like protein cph1 [Paraliobacillus sp. PM-2]|uniref:sensor histidine kinase n=1 Tax=Paraliobacillus sp. PM-2 TaxID=1462524 RepID=UPI00061BB9FB|nr:ATP-binding protein [Paraliobacillus sp. PM-2]CQR47309.1 Phytochrome-like protein cph1 [Paraliobacillus sp. PM-2]